MMLKMIEVDDDNRVRLTGKNMDQFVTGKQEAIQRFLIAFMNTPGSMVDRPTWGGGIKEIFLSIDEPDSKELRAKVGEKVQNTLESLRFSRNAPEDFSIMDATLKNFSSHERGFSAEIVLDFLNATSKRVKLDQDVAKQLRQTQGT